MIDCLEWAQAWSRGTCFLWLCRQSCESKTGFYSWILQARSAPTLRMIWQPRNLLKRIWTMLASTHLLHFVASIFVNFKVYLQNAFFFLISLARTFYLSERSWSLIAYPYMHTLRCVIETGRRNRCFQYRTTQNRNCRCVVFWKSPGELGWSHAQCQFQKMMNTEKTLQGQCLCQHSQDLLVFFCVCSLISPSP